MSPEPQKPPASRDAADTASYLGIGASLAITVLLGLGLGYWLDTKLGTKPVLFLAGALLGLAGAGYQFYKTLIAKKA